MTRAELSRENAELPPLKASTYTRNSPKSEPVARSYTAKSVEARERILVAEIKQLRNLWIAAEERAAHAEEAALSHAEKIERLRASLQIEKDAAALSYKNGMALGEQLHDCQCTVRELRAEREAMRGALLGAIDLAQFWIDRCKAPVMTQAEYNSWVSLGHQSKAMRAAIDAARSAP